MKDDDNFIHNYYAQFLSSNNHEDVPSGSEYYSAERRGFYHKKVILDLLLNKSNNFEWKISLFFSRRQEIIITYGID